MRTVGIDERSAFAKWLRARYGHRPIGDIIRHIAGQLLAASNQSSPPIDLERIGASRRIAGFRVAKMRQDARLRTEGSGFVIEVRPSPETRRRFTIAHEVAHTIFFDLDSPLPRRLLDNSFSKDEEDFCDLLAAEILMPSEMVWQQLQGRRWEPPSPIGMILKLAGVFRVSGEAMARRLLEDLGALEGLALGACWLPGAVAADKPSASPTDWRMGWWAASKSIVGALYVPLASKRPKVGLNLVEEAYQRGVGFHTFVELTSIRLGNMRKTLKEGLRGASRAEVWVQPLRREGVQLGSDNADPDMLMRQRSEVILFFPVATSRT